MYGRPRLRHYGTAGPISLQERCCVSGTLDSVEMLGLLSIHQGLGHKRADGGEGH
jgi:hypothetical protein